MSQKEYTGLVWVFGVEALPRITLSKILLVILAILSFYARDTQARDPYPSTRGSRTKYIVPPQSVENPYHGPNTDPQTMITTEGKRAPIISFSCHDSTTRDEQLEQENRTRDIYLDDPAVDSLEKATPLCAPHNPPYTELRLPYLKNNKATPECAGKTYDMACYDWPIGNYLGRHPKAGKGGWIWATRSVVYGTGFPPMRHPLCVAPNHPSDLCDCPYKPFGPEPWVQLTREVEGVTQTCLAPSYSTSGEWWNWLKSEIAYVKNTNDPSNFNAVNVYLGIDGEDRPYKSGEGWNGPSLQTFYSDYVPKVIEEVKRQYQGKIVRAHMDPGQLPLYLQNDIDFHRESLCSDEVQGYYYRGLGAMGWWQGFANYFYITNTLGFWQWVPFYQSVLSGLSKHTDGITGFMDLFSTGLYEDGRSVFLKFAGSYIGKDINDTPGVWINLRETMHKKEDAEGQKTSGKYGDYDYYLYRPEELEGNHTTPVRTDELPSGTSKQIYNFGLPRVVYPNPAENQYVGRKNAPGNRYMSFDVDDGYRYVGKQGVSFEFRIVFLDVGRETFLLQYKGADDLWREKPVTKTDTQLWQEVTVVVDDAFLNNNASVGSNADEYPTDFRIDSGDTPTTLHLIEVRGKGDVCVPSRPKAQVSCDLVKNEGDDPKQGLYSVGPGQQIKIKATLTDGAGNPLAAERVMFAYNTEWNLAKSVLTNEQGVAYSTLDTTSRQDSSGFLGELCCSAYKVSWYSVQAYYPGSNQYQPSRNDCMLPVTDSTGPNDPDATRMRINSIDTSHMGVDGRVTVRYDILHKVGGTDQVLATGAQEIGKVESFFASDPSLQTVSVFWAQDGTHATFNNVTLAGLPSNQPGGDEIECPVTSDGGMEGSAADGDELPADEGNASNEGGDLSGSCNCKTSPVAEPALLVGVLLFAWRRSIDRKRNSSDGQRRPR